MYAKFKQFLGGDYFQIVCKSIEGKQYLSEVRIGFDLKSNLEKYKLELEQSFNKKIEYLKNYELKISKMNKEINIFNKEKKKKYNFKSCM